MQLTKTNIRLLILLYISLMYNLRYYLTVLFYPEIRQTISQLTEEYERWPLLLAIYLPIAVCWVGGCFCKISFAGIYEIIQHPGPGVVCVVGSGYAVFPAGSKQSVFYNAFCSGVWCGISVAFVGDAVAGEGERR